MLLNLIIYIYNLFHIKKMRYIKLTKLCFYFISMIYCILKYLERIIFTLTIKVRSIVLCSILVYLKIN